MPINRSAFDPEIPDEIFAPRFIRAQYTYVGGVGAVAIDPYQLAHIPVFGTQTERFDDEHKHHGVWAVVLFGVTLGFAGLGRPCRLHKTC